MRKRVMVVVCAGLLTLVVFLVQRKAARSSDKAMVLAAQDYVDIQ